MSHQPDTIQSDGQLPRRSVSRGTDTSAAAHMILLQQPSLLLATIQLPKPSSCKSRGQMMNGTYLPILNSYPRIAPHPSKKLPDKSQSKEKSQNLSKRVCIEHKIDGTPVTRGLPELHLHKQPKLAVSSSGLPCSSATRDSLSSCSPTTVSSSQGSPSGSSLNHNTPSFLLARSGTSTRHRRFLNTVKILRQSGLLDITLRTKELLHQSNATEQDIAQLRQHTELLCQAFSDPSCSLSGVTAWEHLYQSMAESGSYPGLQIRKNEPDSASQTKSFSTREARSPPAAETSDVSPSHFLTNITGPTRPGPVVQQSHSGHGTEHEDSCDSAGTVAFMSPDSSTG